jgi:zinc transport system ATP-binding protein
LKKVLEVDRLSVRFGETSVLTNVTSSVSEGSSLAIVGPNGAGKSVLLRGFSDDLLRARQALAPDSGASIERAMDRVGLSSTAARKLIGTFSGGRPQRLLIGFALLGKPSASLLDEPTAGVDEPGQEQINSLLRCRQSKAVLSSLS